MNKQIKPIGLGLLLVSLMVIGITPCHGQDDRPLLEAIQVKHADANQILRVAASVLDSSELRMEVDEQQNLLVAYGRPNMLARLKEIVAKMDAERSGSRDEKQVKVFAIAEASSNEIANVLKALTYKDESSSIRIASDLKTNSIIVSGSPDELSIIEALVERLDTVDNSDNATTESRNIVVRVTWLVDSAELGEANILDNLRQPSSQLNELVAELQRSGSMKSARSLTQLQTTVQVDSSVGQPNEFGNSSLRNLQERIHIMKAQGQIRPMGKDKFELNISLNLRRDSIELSVDSIIALPINHPVAFSFSDVGDLKSVAVVEVLESR